MGWHRALPPRDRTTGREVKPRTAVTNRHGRSGAARARESMPRTTPCGATARWGHRALPPCRTSGAHGHGTMRRGGGAGGQAAHRALRGGAMGTSRPTAMSHGRGTHGYGTRAGGARNGTRAGGARNGTRTTGLGRCLRNRMAIGSRGRVTNGKWFSKWLRNGRNWCSCWRNRRLCRLSPSLLGRADYRRYRGRRRLRSADP